MDYYSYFGIESKNIEFKSFSLDLPKEYCFETCLDLIVTGRFIFNDLVKETLNIYIKKYLPKYIASFSQNKTKINSLYFGINDLGIIIGIPYQGSFDVKFIENCVSDCTENDIEQNKNISIKVSIHSLNYKLPELYETPYQKYLHFFNNKQKMVHKNYQKYKIWHNCLLSQKEKIHLLLNRDRHKFLEYSRFKLRKQYKHVYSKLYYLCDVPDYYDLLVDLKIKTFTALPKGSLRYYYVITQENISKNFTKEIQPIKTSAKINFESISSNQYNSILLFFLFGRYKDYCIKSINIHKPKKPKNYFAYHCIPQLLLKQTYNMIPLWMENNENMSLFIVQIDCIINFSDNQFHSIKYFNTKKRKFEYCYRIVDDIEGPITVHEEKIEPKMGAEKLRIVTPFLKNKKKFCRNFTDETKLQNETSCDH